MRWLAGGGGAGGRWKAEGWCESEKKEAGRGRHGLEEEEGKSEEGARPVYVRVEAGACRAPVGRGGRSEKPPLGPAGLGRGQGGGGAEGVGWAWCGWLWRWWSFLFLFLLGACSSLHSAASLAALLSPKMIGLIDLCGRACCCPGPLLASETLGVRLPACMWCGGAGGVRWAQSEETHKGWR